MIDAAMAKESLRSIMAQNDDKGNLRRMVKVSHFSLLMRAISDGNFARDHRAIEKGISI